jgi:mannitol/fructose-specific phosphotransferase system IIA component (Ntr-type)
VPGGSLALAEATAPDLLFPRLDAEDADEVLGLLARGLAEAVPGLSAESLRRGFAEREALGSTALGGGLAVPHCKATAIQRAILAVARAPQGIDFGAPDGQPVRVFFAVVSPAQAPGAHLQLLAAISRWARGPRQLERLLEAGDRPAILAALESEV